MEKTKEMILIEKLRRASHMVHGGRHGGPHRGPRGFGPGMPCRQDGGRGPGMFPPKGPQCGPDRLSFQPLPDRGPGMFPPQFPQRGPGMAPGQPGSCRGPKMFPRERILTVVLEAGDNGLRQRDIAEQLGIHAPALTEQIDRLEAERYLERCANPEDKRSTLVRLTEKGRARAYEVADERQARAAAFSANLSEEEKDRLIALLDKLLADRED